MKKKILIFLAMIISTLVFAETGKSESVTVVDEKETGLYITCNVSNASVYLDGDYKGTTPLELNDLKPGRYRLEVTKSHYSTDSSYIYVDEGRIRHVRCDIEKISGYLKIVTNPAGAITYCNGSTCDSYIELDQGEYTISAKKFGYNPNSIVVHVDKNKTSEVILNLSEAEFNFTYSSVDKRRFNPKNHGNLGNIMLDYAVNAPGKGELTFTDETGRVVYSRDVEFNDWTHSEQWLGTDYQDYIVEDGEYTATVTVGDKSASQSFIVDSSIIYPMNLSTPSGAGIGSVASGELYPESSLVISAEVGVLFGISPENLFKASPISAGLIWTPTNFFELDLSFNGMLHSASSIGFNASLKLGGKIEFDAVNLYYAGLFRYGSSTVSPLGKKYIDFGNGIGGGLLVGAKWQDIYFGIESTYLYKAVAGFFGGNSNGNDSMLKNGLMVQKTFDIGCIGAYLSTGSTFGSYDGTNTDGFPSSLKYSDIGTHISFYLFDSTATLGIQAGTYIFPKTGFEDLFSDKTTFNPYIDICFTWIVK